MIRKYSVYVFACLLPAFAAAQETFAYPYTKSEQYADTFFGRTVKDPYRWLEKIGSEETRLWADAQNSLSSAYKIRSYSSLHDFFFGEIKSSLPIRFQSGEILLFSFE